jgi:hypothetical protein
MHQKYIDEGESLYLGTVDSIKVFPGNERVKFTWKVNADPRIEKTVIYWNDGKDSSVVMANRTQAGILDLETVLNIKEGIYNFKLVTKDDEGHKSLATERTVQIYGPKYISNLTSRNLVSISVSGNVLTINWATIESVLIQYTTVRYTDYSDPEHPAPNSVRVENGDTQTVISGIRLNDVFSVASTYLPAGSFDVFESLPIENTLAQNVES